MARTTNSDTLPYVDSRYELGMLASQRVRDLNGGAEPLVDKDDDKLTVVALREFATGKLDVDNLRHEFVQSYKETPVAADSDDSLEIATVEDPKLREIDAELENTLIKNQEMSHSWSSAPHWKCGIPTRVSRVRIPSSPPGIQKIPKSYMKSHKPAGFWDFFSALLLWYVFTFPKSTILPTMTYFAQIQ